MGSSIGILHPGSMGVAIAAACTSEVWWVSDGRSAATRERATRAGLHDAGTVDELIERVDTIVSVCPPAHALDVARNVSRRGFIGTYVDANAVSPASATEIGAMFEHVVDAGIVGPPPTRAGTTRMYVSGPGSGEVARHWGTGPLDVRVVNDRIGAASALKMTYAAWTKGRSALLLAVNALADAHGITGVLRDEWELSQPDLADRSARTAKGVSPKAWRFVGEMHEIAETFAAADLPDGFHLAAAEIYTRLADLADAPTETGEDPDADLVAAIAALRAT